MIPILAGWTLALLVGAATNLANLPIAFVCGAVAGVLPFVAQMSMVKAEQELAVRGFCYHEAAAAFAQSATTPAKRREYVEEREQLHAARNMLAAWTIACVVSVWVTAAVPLVVLWRLRGAP